MAPRFLGANPAQIPIGDLTNVRAMGQKEVLAATIMQSMDRQQQRKTIFSVRAYSDIVTSNDAEMRACDPVGILCQELSADQKNLLIHLLNEYISAMPAVIAQQRQADLRRDELDKNMSVGRVVLSRASPITTAFKGPLFYWSTTTCRMAPITSTRTGGISTVISTEIFYGNITGQHIANHIGV